MIQTIITDTRPPAGLWLKTLKRTGKLFIGDATLKELDKRYLEEFIDAHSLIQSKVNNGIFLKVAKES